MLHTKREALRNPASCLNKADANEPVFILRGKDPTAAMAVRHWVTMNEGVQPPDKLADACAVAREMEKYQQDNYPQPTAERAP